MIHDTPSPSRTATDAASTAAAATIARPSPYLHVGPERIHDPVTDRELDASSPLWTPLRSVLSGAARETDLAATDRAALRETGWLLESSEIADLAFRYHLKYVSLEAHTVCNQGCYFCPVAYDPREAHFMPTEMYEDIVGQLAAWSDTIETVFMINYNEPTADKRFLDQVRILREHGLPPSTLTNGTGLTPDRIDALEELGGLRFLSINLSTLDKDRYAEDRQGNHLDLVMKNLRHAKHKRIGEEMVIVVLGKGDDVHKRDHEAIAEEFEDSLFEVQYHEVMDRAGYLQIGKKARNKKLCGCDNVGSRPFQHLHITPHGQCVLCCEDYDEKYVVGDLGSQSVEEVLTSERFAELRRWVYGVEEAPADFICRNCVFARTC